MTKHSEEFKIENKIRFIRAAQVCIEDDGIDSISIRKIANIAGFHNSTIYLYFKDIDELMMIASLKYFENYKRGLADLSSENLNDYEVFIRIWTLFAHEIFTRPSVYYNFFFGKHSSSLSPYIREYYELFPEESEEFSSTITEMYFGNNLFERCLVEMKSRSDLVEKYSEEQLRLLTNICVAYTKEMLYEAKDDNTISPNKKANELVEAIKFITR